MPDNILTIERTFEAPITEVWKYFSDPVYYAKWGGPEGFTGIVKELDFRVGGKFLGAMRGSPSEGAPPQDFWSIGIYKEIVPSKKIVVTDSFADENGKVVPSSHYGMEGFPQELLVTITFEETDGKTKMTLRHEGVANLDEKTRSEMEQGWQQSFDKIEEHLKNG